MSKKRKNRSIFKELDALRPKIREDCKKVPRPCPYASCRFNTFLDIHPSSGKLKILHDNCEDPSDLKVDSCVLDIVEKHGALTLEEIGTVMNITRERVRQIGDAACRKMRPVPDET
jgi:Sigma-70, region 4